jgi:glucose/arabinose dehydrogenase
MQKINPRFILMFLLVAFVGAQAQAQTAAGRMNEVFKQVDLQTNLSDPWEIAMGPDGWLWVTEARGYRVRRINPANGTMTTALDINVTTTNTPATSGLSTTEFNEFRRTFTNADVSTNSPAFDNTSRWPQGGMMGLAFHPEFSTDVNKRFVYLVYVRSWLGNDDGNAGNGGYVGVDGQGNYFRTFLTRWTWDPVLGKLVSPRMICDTLPGSNDHNSGRLIIAPVGGTNFLFYALGDMGAGQFQNQSRTIRSQQLDSYQGKILRFNLEEDGDAAQSPYSYNRWIPNNNPYSTPAPPAAPTIQRAIWAIGIRNNQGFDYKVINGTGRLYGSSHGPYSDDEINVIEGSKNYGHPLVVGYAADGNYNNAKAGVPLGSSPLIVSESANAAAIGASYADPIYSNYAAPAGTGAAPWTPFHSIQTIYQNPNIDVDPVAGGTQRPQNTNGMWWSEGYSGLEVYTGDAIPGWKNSMLLASLKWGRIVRMKLANTGATIEPGGAGGFDTVSLFGGRNRFRDLAVSSDQNTLYVVMDQNSTSSGPSAANPIVPACAGCVQAHTFLGYRANPDGSSPFPTTIPIAPGTDNTCTTLPTVTINADNNNIWVPIRDANFNIVAEIKANGRNLGAITASIYKHNGANMRQDSRGRLYMNRNISITPATQPGLGNFVDVRLYFTNAELTAIQSATNSAGQSSGITGPSNLGIFKTNGGCTNALSGNGTLLATESSGAFGANGRFIEISTDQFSQFFFGNNNSSILPITLSNFKAAWVANQAALSWNTLTEETTQYFVVERSTDSRRFDSVLTIRAKGQSNLQHAYTAIDASVSNLAATTFYYRLKIVDADGKSSYSATAKLSKDGAGFFVKAFPNPVRNQATLSIFAAQDENFVWKLTDLSGRTVLSKSGKVFRGQNTFTIDMNQLPAGIYQLSVNAPSFSENLKLQKQ